MRPFLGRGFAVGHDCAINMRPFLGRGYAVGHDCAINIRPLLGRGFIMRCDIAPIASNKRPKTFPYIATGALMAGCGL